MSTRQIKILIADDEEHNLRFFEDVLTPENYSIAKARDGFEALDLFEKYQPDIVLLDLMMPRLNGYEVCSRLKHNARARQVPIIMLTGFDDEDARAHARELGVADFLLKPIERPCLLKHIRTHLAASESPQSATQS
jgi:twitching motility two-component system response regulator PilG